MLIAVRPLIFSAILLLATMAHATPDEQPDSMSPLLLGKGLLQQIDQVRQTVTTTASDLVGNAMGFLGVPYKYGGSSVETGFDCSGLVKTVYEQTLGLVLPRRAEQQAAATQKVDRNDLQPGDLVFFNTLRRAFSHVGIYIGDGKFIHSPKPGAEVRVENMGIGYWSRRFDGARRVQTVGSEVAQPQVTQSADPALR
jgi:cell wall-associated NlpC family hydrolase